MTHTQYLAMETFEDAYYLLQRDQNFFVVTGTDLQMYGPEVLDQFSLSEETEYETLKEYDVSVHNVIIAGNWKKMLQEMVVQLDDVMAAKFALEILKVVNAPGFDPYVPDNEYHII